MSEVLPERGERRMRNIPQDVIVVQGARQHNLKNIHLRLPRNRLIVITGPSGSGKSTLAFDTIYAEGQRRYVESLSAYARQFLEQLAKPDVDSITGLSPAIAIEQRPLSRNPRSTVGTVTEIADYLRVLFARVGRPHCPKCGQPIHAQTAQQIVDRITGSEEGAKLMILAPVARQRKGELRLELERLRKDGFVRARIDGTLIDLGDDIFLDRSRPHDLDVVIDRIVIKEGIRARVSDSVELALRLGSGMLLVDAGDGEPQVMSERFACVTCGLSVPNLEPRFFSFNSPHGACSSCTGLGSRTVIDPERCIPDPGKTLREGAVVAWGPRGSVANATSLARAVEALGINPDVPFLELPETQRAELLYGVEKRRKLAGYEGIVPSLTRLLAEEGDPELETDDGEDLGAWSASDLWRFCSTVLCDACHGARLRPEALAVRLGGMNISELSMLPLDALRAELDKLCSELPKQGTRDNSVAEPLLRAILARLGFLLDVGLGYLALDRSTVTLSGGEGQRIRLATQIGSALTGVLYVLDEPSIGLHASDNSRLVEAIRALVDVGNTAIVVEHDRDTMLAADYLVDMGPVAGKQGGYVVAAGTPAEVMESTKSITAPYLSGAKRLLPPLRRRVSSKHIRVVGARANTLKNLDVTIPLGVFTCVTGVSGSGKSSLVLDTLLPAARSLLYGASKPVGLCDAIEGLEQIDKVISIDQMPLGRSPRSNPATYTGIFSLLRELYSSVPEARARGYKLGRFSFNVKGGRCEACQGAGVLRVEMHFLPDVFVPCDACGGQRYGRETLEILYRGLSIADVLSRTIDETYGVFDAVPKIRERLDALRQVGLGYMPLGQSATTLSGGEAQRVKLARELARRSTGQTLYVLDEPTTGLHFTDIEMLLEALQNLCSAGNTVLVIEHNLDVVACADHVIDLGPTGGQGGGFVVAEGSPEQIASTEASVTGKYLAPLLQELRSQPPPKRSSRPLSAGRSSAPPMAEGEPPAARSSQPFAMPRTGDLPARTGQTPAPPRASQRPSARSSRPPSTR